MRTRIAIITPTYNRAHLIGRLADSLKSQDTKDFLWIVVDDASTDNTDQLCGDLEGHVGFPIMRLRNPTNIGKAASLNRAFALEKADFYLVVDSDDFLHPTAVRRVRSKVSEYAHHPQVGAIVFEYVDPSGRPLRPYSVESDLVMTRMEHDTKHQKYDGAVGYYARMLARCAYPSYPGETYMGPSVLHMLMAPQQMVFTSIVIGTAEYQLGGLTNSGRLLRTQNPRGMRLYSGLKLLQSTSLRDVYLQGALFYSYDFLIKEAGVPEHPAVEHARKTAPALSRPVGLLISLRWRALLWRARR